MANGKEERLLSTLEAAKELGITDVRMRQLLQEGRVGGARKVGTTWVIPVGTDGRPMVEIRRVGRPTLAASSDKAAEASRILTRVRSSLPTRITEKAAPDLWRFQELTRAVRLLATAVEELAEDVEGGADD